MGYLVNAFTYRLGYRSLWTDDWFCSRGVSSILFYQIYNLRVLFRFYLLNSGFLNFKFSINDIRILLLRNSYVLQVFLLEFNRGEFFFRLFFKRFFLFLDRGSIVYWRELLDFFRVVVNRLNFWRFRITGIQFIVFCFCAFFYKLYGESRFLTVIFPLFLLLSSVSCTFSFVSFFSLVLFFLKKFNVSFTVFIGVLVLKFIFFRLLSCFPYLKEFFMKSVVPFETSDPVYSVLFGGIRLFYMNLVRLVIQWFLRFYWYLVFYRWLFLGVQYGFYSMVSRFCFFSVLVNFFFLGFREVSVRYIGFWLINRLAKVGSWNVAIKPVQEELFELMRLSIIFGFKIQFAGRFTRRQRSVLCWVTYGRVPFSNRLACVDYFNTSVVLRNGVGCVKVWLYRNFKVGQVSLRVGEYERV